MTPGECARRARIEAGLSIGELAREAAISQETLYRLERNESTLRLDTVLRLCKALDVTPEMYLRGKRFTARKWKDVPDYGWTAWAVRKRRHMTQDALCERSGVGRKTICAFENQTRSLYTQVVMLLADALDVSLDEYLGFVEVKK